MAKELPFFKFDPGAWDNGNIQLCSSDVKGIFVDICAMYWQRLGDLPYKLALQKVCGGNATALESLKENDIIKVIDGAICIDFLNEQLQEFELISSTNAKNAREGWEKRKKSKNYATALPSHSDPNAKREDKIREDEDKMPQKNIGNYYQSAANAFELIKQDELLIEQYQRSLSGKGVRIDLVSLVASIRAFLIDQSVDTQYFARNDITEVKRHLGNWLRKKTGEDFEQYKKAIC